MEGKVGLAKLGVKKTFLDSLSEKEWAMKLQGRRSAWKVYNAEGLI